ncbi:MAG TPA: DUF5916 domain-containing protein [Pyrinomonadaceae bacterium]|nr:DUF5916 domain-containing protein [Pyrinomonadaceae bacterium]
MIAAKYLILCFGLPALLSLPVAAQSTAATVKTTTQAPSPSPSPVSKTGAGKHVVVVPPEKAKPVRIPRFDKPPVIDGKLDDEVWKQAAVFKDFYQVNPGDNIAPSEPTEAFIGYDSKFLYLAFHCYDEPGKVRGTVAKRDEIFGEDNVRVFLDTFNDQRKAYVLGWNPLGIQQDGIMTEGSGTDFSVDIVMESKGQITSDGWVVEVAIPFKSLRYEAGKDKLWGIHVWRNIDRFNDELDSWVPLSRDISSWLSQEAHLTGLEGISTERTLEIIPSLTLSETGKRINALSVAQLAANPTLLDPGRMLNAPIKGDVGLTMKYGITPTVTLDLAINPDFAQVEADQTVVLANQRFPIFFEEKRPFFLEGIDIFQTRLQAVHTRAIVDPDIAVKLTGKRGRNTFGVLLASDNAPGNFSGDERTDPVNLRFLDKNAYIAIVRLKHDVGKESSIGFLGTSYNFIEKHSQLAGIDGRFKLDKQTTFSFQILGTMSRRCFSEPARDLHSPKVTEPCFGGFHQDPMDPTKLVENTTRNFYRGGNGLGYTFSYNKDGRHFYYGANGQGRTRDYRADVGFTRRTNSNSEGIYFGYNSEPKPKARLINWHVNNSANIDFNWQGRSQSLGEEANVSFNFQHNTYLGLGLSHGYERLFEEEFGVKRTATQRGAFFGGPERSTRQTFPYLFAGTKPSKKYSINLFVGQGFGSFDFDFGAEPKFSRASPSAIAARQAEQAGLCDVDPRNVKPQPVVCLALQDPGPGNELNANLSLSYQPTKALSMSLEYNKDRLVRRDTGLVAFDDNIYAFRSTYQFTRFIFLRARVDYDTLSSRARSQFLLGWTPNPGTAFYVGYNDDLVRNGFSPFTGQFEPGFHRNGRTFFIKMSYLFRRSFGG